MALLSQRDRVREKIQNGDTLLRIAHVCVSECVNDIAT